MFKEDLSPKIEQPKVEQPKNKEIEDKLKDIENTDTEKTETDKEQEIDEKLKDFEDTDIEKTEISEEQEIDEKLKDIENSEAEQNEINKEQEIENKTEEIENPEAENVERIEEQQIEDKPESIRLDEVDTDYLTKEEKENIKEKTDWSDKIIDNIKSVDEAKIYEDAGLKEGEVNGKKSLQTEIDWDQKDDFGRTNKERAEQGLSPLNKDGKTVELHHIGQKQDSPLAELTSEQHRSNGNDTILHNKDIKSEIDRNESAKEKNEYWKTRAEQAEAEIGKPENTEAESNVEAENTETEENSEEDGNFTTVGEILAKRGRL